MAERVRDRIRDAVLRYKKELKPPPRPAEQLRLPEFERLMVKLLSGSQKGMIGPIPTTRPLSIRPTTRLEACGPKEVRVTGRAEFALSEHFEGSEAQIEVTIRYIFLEDDRSGDPAKVDVHPPPDFEETGGKYRGLLRRNERAIFRFVTRPYQTDWSGRLYTEADIVREIGGRHL